MTVSTQNEKKVNEFDLKNFKFALEEINGELSSCIDRVLFFTTFFQICDEDDHDFYGGPHSKALFTFFDSIYEDLKGIHEYFSNVQKQL